MENLDAHNYYWPSNPHFLSAEASPAWVPALVEGCFSTIFPLKYFFLIHHSPSPPIFLFILNLVSIGTSFCLSFLLHFSRNISDSKDILMLLKLQIKSNWCYLSRGRRQLKRIGWMLLENKIPVELILMAMTLFLSSSLLPWLKWVGGSELRISENNFLGNWREEGDKRSHIDR